MRARRALLLFAIVLGIAAAAASLTPPPERPGTPPAERDSKQPGGRDRATVPRAEGRAPGAGTVRLRFGPRGRRPERRVAAGAHVVLTVAVTEPGQVVLAGLGLSAPAEPDTPAAFDLLASEPGRFDAVLAPVEGRRRRVGTLVVGRAPRREPR